MKRYLIFSLLLHLSLGLNFVSCSTTNVTEIVQVEYIETPEFGGEGKSQSGGLFGVKSAYELSKSTTSHGGDLPSLSDQQEIDKESKDEESRPSHMKKEVLFKNYVDMTGERAVIPWFNEVEKITNIKKAVHDRTFITTVIVIINRKGQVVKVVISGTSGDTLMDLSVKNAFLGQDYGPPPKTLLDPDGFARIKWIFEMHLDYDKTRNKQGKIKIYRKN